LLVGAQAIPFVSNNTLTSSSDGKVHTFRWSGVPNIDSVHVQLWGRSQMGAVGNARFVASARYGSGATSYVIDLNQPGSPFVYDRPYMLEVQLPG
jgi:hypothetical protein